MNLKIFKKKKDKSTAPIHKGVPSIFDELKRIVYFQWAVIVVLIILLALSIKNNSKPPLTFRYDPKGDVEVIEDYEAHSNLQKVDIELFVDHFIRNFDFINGFTLEENLPRALNMMTPPLRKYYMSQMKEMNLEKISERKIRTKTKIQNLHFEIKNDLIFATVYYQRQLIGFNNETLKDKHVRAEMVIAPTLRRSKKTPYRLMLKQYMEQDLDKETDS